MLRPTLLSKEHGDQDLDTLDMECKILSHKSRLGTTLTIQVNFGRAPVNPLMDTESPVTIVSLDFLLHTPPKLYRVEHCVTDYSKR